MPEGVSMANRSRPTLQKREREKARLERQRHKEQRRQESKERRSHAAPRLPGDEDPDLAGITPGPQPLADWQLEDAETES
jgi:hypothetical protein